MNVRNTIPGKYAIRLLIVGQKDMANEIIPYIEMCRREGVSLQRGMNYELCGAHSVILMSVRVGSPYADRFEDDGSTVIYEGHDVPKSTQHLNPKSVDQPEHTPTGQLTENGKFHKAAQDHKAGLREPERIRVYEKIKQGIWSYNGVFHLVDSWQERKGERSIFKFKLVAVEGEEDFSIPIPKQSLARRVIPTAIKLEVWKRDGGKCAKCVRQKTSTSTTSSLGQEEVLQLPRITFSFFAEDII